MPNFKGGKAYKKKKGGEQNAIIQIDRQPDQQVARVIRVLGNRNMLCYCNDNLIRVCHVRGKLRNRVYIELGDVILISLRDFDEDASGQTSGSSAAPSAQPAAGIPLMPGEVAPVKEVKKEPSMRGDILAKYPPEYHSKLKKEDGVNPRLFLQLETMGDKHHETIRGKKVEDEGGFEFDRDGESKSESSADDEDLDIDTI